MEQYASQEALDAHSQSDHFREANKILAGLVAAASRDWLLPAVTRLERRGTRTDRRAHDGLRPEQP